MKLNIATILCSAGLCASVQAGEVVASSGKNLEAAVQKEDTRSIYDKIWGLATLYKNEDNPYIQEFALQGRIQLQYAWGDSDQGDFDSGDRPEELRWGDIEVRRWRLGFKSKILRQFKLEGQIDVNPNFELEEGANPELGDGFYRDIYDLFLTWAPNDKFNLSVGKTKAKFFTHEYFTSSKEILVFERGLLVNQIRPAELTGIWANGKIDNFVYAIAGFAGEYDPEFGGFDGGAVIQASVGYDLASAIGTEKALVKFDYMYSSSEENTEGPASYEHAFSLNSNIEQGRWSVYTDLLGATGRGSVGDVWGFMVTPAVFIADSLQLVLRYQYAHGDNDGLRLQSRYERLASDLTDGGRGEEYNAVYLGLNYYLYGHKLKLMTGVEYNNMDGGGDGGDYDGWTGLVGLRMFF
ncbi:phosphate-selective porin OprO/OprP [Roseimicrobium gellanilyticum]|uniref:Phosphate-selective porin OprO/OprP n=1 Tax=Roseimicrobium gellanilyticum TaxID=748857 RepID=A0A366HT08_9BACT|nr:porin [Roseimicrobium gellanilyticum]RBP47227.1 phosphate-selective porin OprO/OprP [Roseimicrobium gellanilyticum]